MARYSTAVLSQAAQLAGVNAALTVNGYIGYWGASAASGFRLRRLQIGTIAVAGVPTSQQMSLGIYRQSVAPAGTGLAAAVLGEAMEIWTPVDPTTGIIVTTAAAIGTTAPTLNANPLAVIPFNTQNTLDVPYELLEELICNKGAANGLAFVNIGNALPASHSIRLTAEIEV